MTTTMMVLALIAVGMMALEFTVARIRGHKTYGKKATSSSLINGIGSGISATVASTFVLYNLVETNFGVIEFTASSWVTWAVAIFALDFVFYWAHRIVHTIPMFWAIHEVHHSSNEYNVATGIRAPWLQPLMYGPFTMLLALSGIPIEVMIPVYLGQQIWKLGAHTEMVGSLGPLEWFMATPKRHSLHHAKNEAYENCNFGGLFLIWDLMFGTFKAEDEAPEYGLQGEMALSPIEDNFGPWKRLWEKSRQAQGPVARVGVFLWRS